MQPPLRICPSVAALLDADVVVAATSRLGSLEARNRWVRLVEYLQVGITDEDDPAAEGSVPRASIGRYLVFYSGRRPHSG